MSRGALGAAVTDIIDFGSLETNNGKSLNCPPGFWRFIIESAVLLIDCAGGALSIFVIGDLSRFSSRCDRIFSGEALNPSFREQDAGFSKFRST